MVSKKKIMNVIAGIAGIAALGLSNFSFAGGDYAVAPAPVAGCDMGAPGFYVGGRVGYGNNYWDNIDYTVVLVDRFADTFTLSRSAKHTGFAGGVEVGYKFNKYVAIEAGFMGLPRAKVTHEALINGAPFIEVFPNGVVVPSAFTRSINNYAFDISGKISVMFPQSDNVGLFAKAGVGFLQSQFKNRDDNNWWGWGLGYRHDDSTRSNTNLTYGFGIFWNFTPNMTLDGRFQRWHGNPSLVGGRRNWDDNGWGGRNDDGHQPYMDAYTIGLTYFFDGTGELFNT